MYTFSPIGSNVFFCCSQCVMMCDDILKLTSRHCHSLLSSDIAYFLLELMNVRDGTFYLHDFDDVLVQSFLDCVGSF